METVWHVLSVIASLTVPFIAWLGKSYLNLHDRLIKTETQMEERTKALAKVEEKQDSNAERITKLEGTLNHLQTTMTEMRDSAERRHAEVTSKLELLPSINANLENLARICATIVPREVYEAQMAAQNAKIEALGQKQ